MRGKLGLDKRYPAVNCAGVNDSEREHVRLIFEAEFDASVKSVGLRIEAIYADHSMKGYLRSGATIRTVIDCIDVAANELLTSSIQKIREVKADEESHATLAAGTDVFLNLCERDYLPRLFIVAGAGEAAANAGQGLYSAVRQGIAKKVEIARFDFARISMPADVELPMNAIVPHVEKAKGGRPRAEFWDDLWAATAAALHVGDLQPKTQADIEKYMLDWLESHKFNSNTSTVRPRARRLWQLIEADL